MIDKSKKEDLKSSSFKSEGREPVASTSGETPYKDSRKALCANHRGIIEDPEAKTAWSVAVFAGGCFWGVEHFMRRLEGVKDVIVGFMGGHVAYPSYEEVCTNTTGHSEVVWITYDSSQTNYSTLLRYFFEIHDPCQLDGQGIDIGEQYESVIFYYTQWQKTMIEETIAELKGLGYDVMTRVKKAGIFYPAENYHQNYMKFHPHAPECHAYVKRFK